MGSLSVSKVVFTLISTKRMMTTNTWITALWLVLTLSKDKVQLSFTTYFTTSNSSPYVTTFCNHL